MQNSCFPCGNADRAAGASARIPYRERVIVHGHGEVIVNGLLGWKTEAERHVLVLGTRINEAVIAAEGDRVRVVPKEALLPVSQVKHNIDLAGVQCQGDGFNFLDFLRAFLVFYDLDDFMLVRRFRRRLLLCCAPTRGYS